jgi:transposase-like protein
MAPLMAKIREVLANGNNRKHVLRNLEAVKRRRTRRLRNVADGVHQRAREINGRPILNSEASARINVKQFLHLYNQKHSSNYKGNLRFIAR